MPIPLISKIKPYNAGAFPVFEDVDGYGGYQVRTTIADRNSIPALNRKIGMAVYVQADGYLYTLGTPGDNSNWLQSSDNNMFGDVTGSTAHSTVVGLQGRPISSAAPIAGMALVWTGSSWTPEDLIGDVNGSILANTVTALQHNPVDSTLLGASQDGYVATWINSSGKIIFKPTTTEIVNLSGDVTGTTAASVVINIHGASVPIAGALTTGNVLQVSGPSSLIYAPINLGGGSNFVTGVLGSGNLPSLAGDVIGTIPATSVVKLRGNPVLSQSLGVSQDGYVLTWVNADGYWEAKLNDPVVGTVRHFPFLAGVATTNNTSLFVVMGSAEFNPITIPVGFKSIRLQMLLETTGPVVTARLFNYSSTTPVTGSTLSTSNIATTLLTTGDLQANITSGSAIYQAQFEMGAGGGTSDFVTCSMARFLIQY